MATKLMSEIEALRGQIEALTKQIPAPGDSKSATGEGIGMAESMSDTQSDASGFESETVSRVKEQLEEFVEMLEKQLNEIPAGTAIAIFALGVVLGRLLPR
jgi:hypothetical protein